MLGNDAVRRVVEFVCQHTYLLCAVVSLVVGFVLLRQYVAGSRCPSKSRLDGKFVLITGANTGIGKAIAIELQKRGARVMVTCRNPQKGAHVAADIFKMTGKPPFVRTVDLASLNSVRSFADDINKREARLDILINNDGVMASPYRCVSRDGYELQFATNHLGHFLLTNMLLDLLKKSAPARIINVSAKAYLDGTINIDDLNSEKSYGPLEAYTQSKLANMMFIRELSRRLHGSGVTVNSLHPGIVPAELGRHLEKAVPRWLRPIKKPLVCLLKLLFSKTGTQGIQTAVYCAADPSLHDITGHYFSDCHVEDLQLHAKDDVVAKKLWDLSEDMVKLHMTSSQ